MARSWMFRLCVLVLGGVIVLSWHNLGIVSENYRVAISTLKVAMADGGLALDSDTKAKLLSTTQRLERTVKVDLMSLGPDPWLIGQAIVAIEEGEQPTRPVFAQKAISLIRSNETDGCFCWAEVPS